MVRLKTDKYVERITLRDYSGVSLFAEIGGYVGLFLGLCLAKMLHHWFEFCVWARERASQNRIIWAKGNSSV